MQEYIYIYIFFPQLSLNMIETQGACVQTLSSTSLLHKSLRTEKSKHHELSLIFKGLEKLDLTWLTK